MDKKVQNNNHIISWIALSIAVPFTERINWNKGRWALAPLIENIIFT